MASSSSSSSRSWRYDVFPSFRGEQVRKSFLSHMIKELDRRSINTFKDHGIERSRPIGPELVSAIRESRISIVVFSKKYASSTWCLNELVEIHKSFKELDQMVIPVFYHVDPSHVRKQTGEFGKFFKKTCKGKTEDHKRKWMQALAEVANMAGEDLQNWCNEADMIEKIADDVSNKLITPSNCYGDFVGIEAHLEAMSSMLCLESEEARMVGILGPSGIGKSTIARALFSQLSSKFQYRAFVAYKRTNHDDYGMKLCWEEQLLSEILGQKDLRIYQLGVVEQRLKHKKVLIFLDDVDDIELLKTLVGQTKWFGSGSRVIVITQDRQLLKAHEIDLIYEVKFPSEDLALKMLCRSAFGQNSPPGGFLELAVKVAKLAGNLPLGLSVLGSSFKKKDKKEWMEMLPRLQNGLDGKIEKILRVGYDRLDGKDQELFLVISFACLFDGFQVDYINLMDRPISVRYIKHLLGDSVHIGLKMLADKSLIRITPYEIIEMHNLLKNCARELFRAESKNNTKKCRFLVDVEDILDAFTHRTGTETVLGIYFNTLEIKEPFSIDEKSFEGMRNLQFLIVRAYVGPSVQTGGGSLHLPQGLVYLPRKLRLLKWDEYPFKCLPSSFTAECLVELRMENSSLEKLWEGSQSIGSLVRMNLSGSENLKEFPDLSKATNLERLELNHCKSLVRVPCTIGNLNNLVMIEMKECTRLEALPTDVNLLSLRSLDLSGCSSLTSFPQISRTIEILYLNDTAIEQVPCCIENFSMLTVLMMHGCKRLKTISPSIFRLTSLEKVDFSDCGEVTALSDTFVMEDQFPPIPFGPRDTGYFAFHNCFKLDGDARALIQRSYSRPTVLPGGEVPTYFMHRASGNFLTVTLPQRSLSPELFEFKACVVVEPLTNREGFDRYVRVCCHFRGLDYGEKIFAYKLESCKADHLVLGSFKFRPIGRPSKLDSNDVDFEFFFDHRRIKGCGVLLSNIFSAPNGCESEDNQDSRSNKRMRMTSAVWPNFTVYGIDGSESGSYVSSGRSFSLSFF